jgi:uncharacterized membrane protein
MGDGAVRLILRAPSFDALAATAFEQIRHYGANNPAFARHLTAALEDVAELAPPHRRRAILHFAATPETLSAASA